MELCDAFREPHNSKRSVSKHEMPGKSTLWRDASQFCKSTDLSGETDWFLDG
jgi:hypothetical protein